MAATTCAVCKLEIEEKKARGTTAYKETTYYFCSKACKKKFDELPEQFAKR